MFWFFGFRGRLLGRRKRPRRHPTLLCQIINNGESLGLVNVKGKPHQIHRHVSSEPVSICNQGHFQELINRQGLKILLMNKETDLILNNFKIFYKLNTAFKIIDLVYRVKFDVDNHQDAYQAVKDEGIKWISEYGGMNLQTNGSGYLVTEEEVGADEVEDLESIEALGVILEEEEVYQRFDGEEISLEGMVEFDSKKEGYVLLE